MENLTRELYQALLEGHQLALKSWYGEFLLVKNIQPYLSSFNLIICIFPLRAFTFLALHLTFLLPLCLSVGKLPGFWPCVSPCLSPSFLHCSLLFLESSFLLPVILSAVDPPIPLLPRYWLLGFLLDRPGFLGRQGETEKRLFVIKQMKHKQM